ncbi:right-handed parallel beta-helix repeat-containing protein [Compostibacter hankyongensis]|uniref:Right handed beta helix domain-containing protein n=1 Tax=Compostibacter hankyongensis TaxID=1007089 RepID=A0ABP8FUG7_9BACT
MAHAQSFVHPGIDQSAKDLAYLKQLIARKQEPWKSAYDKLVKDTDTTFAVHAHAHVLRGPYAKPNIGGDDLSQSATVAYNCALLWYLTKDRNYAHTAIRILDGWSDTLWDFDYNDAKLLAGWTGHAFCNAAEILRYTDAGWSQKGVDRFTHMLMTVYYPLLRYYFPTANGNWDGAICHSLLAIAIFTDNRPLFNDAVDHLLHGPVNGSIFKYIYPNGQCEESGRDQGHVQLGLDEFAGAAQVAFTQGVDLFSIGDNRIGRGYEYTTGYLLGHTPYCYCEISPRAMHLGGGFEYVYRHYAALGIRLPFVARAADSMRAKVPQRTLTAVRAAFAHAASPIRTLVNDSTAYIAGADKDVPDIPADAIQVQPGQSVQQALDRAAGTGRWVVLAKGVHPLDTALKLPSGVTLSGMGTGSVLFLKPEAGRDAIVNATDDLHDITLRNFVVEGALQPHPGNDPNSSRSFNNKGNRGGVLFRSAAVNRMHGLHFMNLTVRNCTYNGVFISGARDLTFSGCDLNENGAAVVPGPKLQHNLLLTHCSSILVRDSRLDGSPNGSGIYLQSCEQVSVTDNELARNALNGISVSESAGITITGNLIEGNDQSGVHAEYLYTGNRKMTVSGNRIHFNGGYGIESYGTDNISIQNNLLSGNGIFTGTIDNKDQLKVADTKKIVLR